MNLKEQLKYDKLQLIKSRLYSEQVKTTIQTTTETTKTALEGPKTIEIAGKKILAMPLESMAFTPEQQEKFKTEAKGFEIDCLTMSKAEQKKFAENNPETPIDWQVSFETLQVEIDGTLYSGFELFKKVYEAFPDIQSMTKDEAIKVGIYPTIHYRNHAARKWMAEMNGGHLATLDEDFKGELRDIYNAASGNNNLERLAAMGQAPLGGRVASFAEVYSLGGRAVLGSGSLRGFGDVRSLEAHRVQPGVGNYYWQWDSFSSVVVLNK